MTTTQAELAQVRGTIDAVTAEVNRHVVLPREDMLAVEGAFMINGAVLLEGPNDTGKSWYSKVLSHAVGGKFGRVQGNSDLMPSDITGNMRPNPKTGELEFVKGPLFSNVLHDDEINRTPPKTQAALLEGMEEGQVTVWNETYLLPRPFLLVATQNPLESGQGIYPLPKALLARFCASLQILPQSADTMVDIHNLTSPEEDEEELEQATDLENILAAQSFIKRLARGVTPDLLKKAANLVVAARNHPAIDPELTILSGYRPLKNIVKLAGFSAVAGAVADKGATSQIIAEHDIAYAARYVLPHRIGLSYEAEEKGTTRNQIVQDALATTGFKK